MGDQEETHVKTVVTPARNTETVYDGELSPALNDSGNIQDAQPQPPPGSHDIYESNSENEVHVTVYSHSGTHEISEEEEDEDPFIYGDADANATNNDSPLKQRDNLFDHLDAALDGLTKELFIATLLQLTGSAEDLVSRYRSELAVRAKRCKNGPTGALITRRSTAKGSVSEKFAADCYLLYQFINGNTLDISELFKPQQGTISSRLNSTCIGDDNAPTLKSEITLMKETMTQLLTDVNLLKTNFTQTQETLNTVSDSLKKDISRIKLELDACKLKCTQTINTEKYPKAAQSTCLADKLSHIGWMITRLDNSRILLEQKSRDLERCINDNSMGLSELRDRKTSGNNALKCQIRDIRENMEEFKESTNSKVSTDSGTMYADMSKRIKSIEKRVDRPRSSKLESSFNDLSKTVSFKIDKLCSVVEQALINRPSTQFHENLHRDCSTGKFVRLPQNELNDSSPGQRIANNTLPYSADISQHNDSSAVANKSFVATPL